MNEKIIPKIIEIQINSTITLKHRRKRSLSDFLKDLSFNLETPSVDWSKSVGSDVIGASIGLVTKNRMELKLSTKPSIKLNLLE